MIRLLVVDDSPLMRRLLGDIFATDPEFELAFARDGLEALSLLQGFAPHVITLDVNMPGLNGLETLDRIMLERPCPVVMFSALTTDGADAALEALELGAVEVLAKPTGAVSLKMDALAGDLIATVRAASTARVKKTHRLAERIRLRAQTARLAHPPARRPVGKARSPATGAVEGLVVVGSSTGGPPALEALLTELPGDFPWPIVVAQHMPASFTGSLARRLDGLCALTVVEADRATTLEAGTVYIGRGDADMILSRRAGAIVALPAPSSDRYRWHPSVDRLMHSAMEVLPATRLAGVLMTGMGNDGAAAMTDLRAAGGWTVAESEATAVVWGMPGELVKAGGATVVADLPDIGGHLLTAVVGA